jgi:hypothetical protein
VRPPAQKLEIDDGRKARGQIIDPGTLRFEERQALRQKKIMERHTAIEGAITEIPA